MAFVVVADRVAAAATRLDAPRRRSTAIAGALAGCTLRALSGRPAVGPSVGHGRATPTHGRLGPRRHRRPPRLAGAGPRGQPARGRRGRRRAARRAPTARPALVREFTGLARRRERTAPVLVVDRPGWIQANADGFADACSARSSTSCSRAEGPAGAGRRGGRLPGHRRSRSAACSASWPRKVLGQFDPFSRRPATGRLLLVAPNIVHVERELGADPHDFRLWVCLHEETHRVQFTAVPWMRDHLLGEIARRSPSTTRARSRRCSTTALKRVAEAGRAAATAAACSTCLGTPEQREIIDRLTGVMSLLEGHADVVMDGVGPR